MKKLLREDGPVLLISLLTLYLAFRAAIGWGWHFAAAGAFGIGLGLAAGVLTQVLMILAANRHRDAAQTDGAAADADGAGEPASSGGSADDGNPAQDYNGAASGTGAEESGPRGPVERPEEYRSSLEDPKGTDEPNGSVGGTGRGPS